MVKDDQDHPPASLPSLLEQNGGVFSWSSHRDSRIAQKTTQQVTPEPREPPERPETHYSGDPKHPETPRDVPKRPEVPPHYPLILLPTFRASRHISLAPRSSSDLLWHLHGPCPVVCSAANPRHLHLEPTARGLVSCSPVTNFIISTYQHDGLFQSRIVHQNPTRLSRP